LTYSRCTCDWVRNCRDRIVRDGYVVQFYNGLSFA